MPEAAAKLATTVALYVANCLAFLSVTAIDTSPAEAAGRLGFALCPLIFFLVNFCLTCAAEAASYRARFVGRLLLKEASCIQMAEAHLEYGNHSLMSLSLPTAVIS